MKIHCKGKRYKVQEVRLGSELMYVVAKNDDSAIYKAFSEIDKAKDLWEKMEAAAE
jgi:hypothetical protein